MLFVFGVPQWIVVVPAAFWIFLVCFWAKSPPGGWISYNKLWWLHWVTFILFTLNRTLESGWTKRSSWPTWGLSPAPVQRWPLLSTSVSIHNKTIQLMSQVFGMSLTKIIFSHTAGIFGCPAEPGRGQQHHHWSVWCGILLCLHGSRPCWRLLQVRRARRTRIQVVVRRVRARDGMGMRARKESFYLHINGWKKFPQCDFNQMRSSDILCRCLPQLWSVWDRWSQRRSTGNKDRAAPQGRLQGVFLWGQS